MIISWNVTRACNLRCLHCYRDAGIPYPQELNFEEAKELLGEIAKAGFKILVLSGGEPLLRKDIYEIIAFAISCGLRPVLGTNGTLIDRNTAKKLKHAGLARVGISLDSSDSNVHDEFRQEKGAWDATVRAMKICREEGLELQVHTTVSKKNFKEIEKIIDFASEIGAKAHHIFFLIPTGRCKDKNIFISSKDIGFLLYRILKKQKQVSLELKPVCAPQFIPVSIKLGIKTRFKQGCLAGLSYCCILPNGDVHPCPYLPMYLGNVRKIKFSQIWKENEVFTRLRSLNFSGKCGNCVYKNCCGGCRARAYYNFNDYMAEDSECGCYESKRKNIAPEIAV